MLQKILEKFFVNKEYTQCKTSHILQIDIFKIPHNKNIGILLFLDQANNSSSDTSQILILQFPIFRASLLPSPSLSFFTLANWSPSSTQSSVSLFCPTHSTTHHQAKSIKSFIKLYADINTLWVKHNTHQKAESSRAASFSKLENMVNNYSISNTKYAEFSIK